MSKDLKVVWNEGVLIAPQHFQQLERHYDNKLSEYYLSLQGFGWGVTNLELNLSSLKLGELSVERVSGFFQNGGYFNESIATAPNLKIKLAPNLENEIIYLVWTVDSSYKRNYGFIGDKDHKTVRFLMKEVELEDSADPSLPKRSLMLACPNLRLSLLRDIGENDLKLPIARIVTTSKTSATELDNEYIPPTVVVSSSQKLGHYVSDIMGLLKQRISALTNLLNNPTLKGTGEVRDFLMLQTINRYFAYLHHVSLSLHAIHPHDLYGDLIKLYADLCTFNADKTFSELPVYDHDQIGYCYKELSILLKESLSTVLQQRAVMIPLELRDEATRVALTPDVSILNTSKFVLAIGSSISEELLRQRIPTTIKVGSVEMVRELVAYHLPGIKVNALPVAPREIPYHAGYSYFELDKGSELWDGLLKSSGMAIHLAGDFPDLEMECWAIKQK
ncbi:type VI secretion system baseplate subunit TssK [Acinetobacter faecalis]|uniref:type VI secretion system baseplate subunit TssK n=1 Tax=Acinetobacter faecalis TaxID=2665161 RepID=UPI002A90DED1|nr:type VI secretion system baseplate subunit TssK [Acinetobacter faecalis]MDY6450941.1 type VI secretion system baseplate subunit TssK [Acinetobacter faecalis]